MKLKGALLAAALVAMTGSVLTPAQAQFAVFDPANFTQNLQQVGHMLAQLQKLQTQIQTARDTLDQQRAQYDAITGSRGMGALRTDQYDGYLPGQWNGALTGGNGELEALAEEIKRTAGYLQGQDLARINSAYRDALRRSGDRAANNMAGTAAVFEQSSERFQRLEVLMNRIDTAQDDKAIQDLQARIQVEQVMLQNELIRAQAMAAMVQQQQAVERQRQHQRASSHSFDY